MNLRRKRKIVARIAKVMLFVMLFEVLAPLSGKALTSGPSQPEVQQFAQYGTSGMVDLFTGDFSYNIPLFELPGPNGSYPFNLSYQSGISMDQEATWVGLGWNLNPGAITRQMRGLPDEFAGDLVKVEQDMKADVTVGVNVGGGAELFGSNVLQGSASLKLYYNSLHGFGYGVSVGASLDLGQVKDGHVSSGLNLSLDPQEGIGFAPRLGFSRELGLQAQSFNVGIGYSSRTGLSNLQTNYTQSLKSIQVKTGITHDIVSTTSSGGIGSSVGFANPGYVPDVGLPTVSLNFAGTIKLGAGGAGFFGHGTATGFFSSTTLKEKRQNIAGYGYRNLESAEEKDMTDINRESDGILHKESGNLAIPSLQYDIFSVTGQGIGGAFRAYRNDIGITGNRKQTSVTAGGNFGLDVGGGHFGNDFAMNGGISTSGTWKNNNLIISNNPANNNELYGFHDETNRKRGYETTYFRFIGEHASTADDGLDYMYGDEPVRIKLEKAPSGPDNVYNATPRLQNKNGQATGLTTFEKYHFDSSRVSRNSIIQAVKIDELGSNAAVLGEFDVEHYVHNANNFVPDPNNLGSLSRQRPGHHDAGITVTESGGTRYVYALPAYNTKQVETVFTVDGGSSACGPTLPITVDYQTGKPNYKVPETDQYYNRTEIPAYAHSYLLTSVLGQDYVDADDVPGPSDGDFGYWVKFNYVKVNTPFKWRAPFNDANLNKGRLPTVEDDRGTFMYGERETWYLGSAETKTHIAEFHLSPRLDGRGAIQELQNTPANTAGVASTQGAYAYKLDKISLYSKIERVQNNALNPNADPIREVHFRFSNSLCKNLPNNVHFDPVGTNVHPQSGKLTLDSLWFTHEDSYRGDLSKYVFDYDATNNLRNPDYNTHKQDRWGNYNPFTDFCDIVEYPYTNQYLPRIDLDAYASAWTLRSIELPSGGLMTIDYEADDYAYVQDKPAARMFKVKSLASGVISNRVYDQNYKANYTDGDRRRIYFELPNSVTTKEQMRPYFKDLEQLYGKFKMDIKKPNQLAQDYVKGYFTIEDYGPDPACSGGPCNTGFVQLAPPPENDGKWIEYPPIALAAWHHLRTNLPKQVNSVAQLNNLGNGTVAQAARQRWLTLANIAPEMIRIFSGYYNYAYQNFWAERIDLDHSWIRLNEPDQIKVGGGCRVKRIVLDDKWAEGNPGTRYSNVVGTVYDYSKEVNGKIISSGVAQYEPLVGGDENPLRVAKSFPVSTPLKSDYSLFFEFPTNEQYMPSANVGYSKVTIKSLATENVIDSVLANTVPTTGAAIHEFWTAKEFPVISGETDIDMQPFYLPFPLPFVGALVWNDVTASQGYSIVLNDMHGKQRKVSNYGMTEVGQLDKEPISWVEYEYNSFRLNPGSDDEKYRVLNDFKTLLFDVDDQDLSKSKVERRKIGEEHEYFVDMRQSKSLFSDAGLALNVDIVGLPLPSVWPSFTMNHTRTRTAVTNKIIHRTGILTGMRAWNEGSLIETQHLLWDAQTGSPLLSKVTNNYNDPVYSYQYPAFWAYDRMGPAYKNIGLEFTVPSISGTAGIFAASVASLGNRAAELLIPGDELLVSRGPNRDKAWFIGFDNSGNAQFFSEAVLNSGSQAKLKIIRSGRQNLLGASAASVTSLKNPTVNRDTLICYRDITNPTQVLDSCWTTTDTLRDTFPSPCINNFFQLVELIAQNPNATNVFGLTSLSSYCISANQYTFPDPTTLQFGIPNFCGYRFADGNGNFIPIADIQQLGAAVIDSVPIISPPANFVYSNLTTTGFIAGGSGPQVLYLYQTNKVPCILPIITTETIIPNYQCINLATPSDSILADTLFMLDSVLSASATTFSDAWIQDFTDVRFEKGNPVTQLNRLKSLHPYASGERGIWRGKDSYVYVADRQQSNDLNTRKDGTFSGMPMFNFQSLNFTSCAQNWRHVNEITRYSPYSYELENQDVLGVYSAALYGYNGKLPVAVSANADYRELGFESFEEYAVGAQLQPGQLATGNIDIYTSNTITPLPVMGYENVAYAQGNTAWLSNNAPAGLQSAKIEGRSQGSTFDPGVYLAEHKQVSSANNNTVLFQNDVYLHNKGLEFWKGRLGFDRPVLQAGNLPLSLRAYTDQKAHTGKRALAWTGTSEFAQNRLKLQGGKTYALQLWLSRDDENVPTYRDRSILNPADRLGVQMKFYDAQGNFLTASDLYEPSGRIVEGWQKLEAEIEVPFGTENVVLRLQSGKINSTITAAYLDDIRIQPLVSKMSCYIYDTGDYRLTATLDDDNFALLYHYDESGNLYLIQKETVDGLRTIQESRGFTVERP